MKKVALHNLGCKVNAYETEAMREMLGDAGYEIVPFGEWADVYIINTCTVTNIADRKSRQMLHRAKKQNPDAIVVAAGCYVQAQERGARPEDPCVDIIIGNNRKKELLRVLNEYEAQREQKRKEQKVHDTFKQERAVKKELIDIGRAKEYEDLRIGGGARARAFIKVQDGCNQFCSYCIIPLARGRARSRDPRDVVGEVTALARDGCREVVLTGIHLSSYGLDKEEEVNLLSLIEAVHGVNRVERIRLGSLEPCVITEEFACSLAAMPKVCPHFHLSLQSGCDATLSRMNRRYTSAQYYEKCLLLRKYFDNPALTTDIIVGFPGETEEEFAASKAFVEKVGFYETHIFKYSRREGTRAAAMENQVAEQEKARRGGEMTELGVRKRRQYEESLFGRELEVLLEEPVTAGAGQAWCGHTREYLKVVRDGDESMRNQLIKFTLTKETKILH